MKRRDEAARPEFAGGTAWRSSDRTLPHLAAVLVAAGAIVSCGSGESDSDRTAAEIEDREVGETEDLLSLIGPNQLVTPSAASPQGNETSATFINGGAGTIFVSYNSDPGLPWPDTTETHCGWSRSTNGGTTWASTDDHSTPLPGYGAGSGGIAYRYCLGDTFAAPPGPAYQVAMTAVTWNGTAQNPKQTRDVALWVSINGGVTFPNVARVSTAAGSDGQTDGPKMAADPTNHTVWVSWYNGNGSNGSVFLRPMTVGSGGSITAGATVNLTNKLGVPAPVQAHIAVRPAVFQGWLPTIYLAYPDAGMLQYKGCDDPGKWVSIPVRWWLSVSVDGGQNWTNYLVDADPSWPRCISAENLAANRSYITLAYDAVSERVILAYSRHMDDAAGTYVGTRVVTKQWPAAGGGVGFDTWIPVCNPSLCAYPNCLVSGAPPVGETFCHQFGPAVQRRRVGSSSRAVVVWHDTRDAGGSPPHPAVGDSSTVTVVRSDVWGHSVRPGVPFDGPPNNPPPATQSRLTPLGSTVPWLATGINGNAWWGDYECGIADMSSGFFGVWADDRDGSTTTKLRGASFNE